MEELKSLFKKFDLEAEIATLDPARKHLLVIKVPSGADVDTKQLADQASKALGSCVVVVASDDASFALFALDGATKKLADVSKPCGVSCPLGGDPDLQ